MNTLIENLQHVYRKGHSTFTSLVQMTDDWYRDMRVEKKSCTLWLHIHFYFIQMAFQSSGLLEDQQSWYRDMDNKMICGAVLLHFTAAFDVVDLKRLSVMDKDHLQLPEKKAIW